MTPPESRGALRAAVGIARSGAGAVALHPLRSAATVACVFVIVLPFVAGAGISAGLKGAVEAAVREGPDLYVTATRFGRPVPLPPSAAAAIAGIPGVTGVFPRVVGEVRLGSGRESAVLIGLPAGRLPVSIACVAGRVYRDDSPNELLVGSELAARLGLRVGDRVPPFYRNDAGERVTTVVGVFGADSPPWLAHALFVSPETARRIFAEGDSATDLLVRCPPGYLEPVAERIRSIDSLGGAGEPPLRPRVTSRDDVEALLLRRVLDRETLFQLPFVLAFALGIVVVLVTSGAGLVERRREAGLLRAIGWSQDALLFRALVESVLVALAGASLATLAASAWLGVLNGAGLAPVLLPGAGRVPGFRVPWDLGPVPVLLAFAISSALVAAGTLASTWRAATAPPAEAMR